MTEQATPTTSRPAFRVLALDGGGARAWLSAHRLTTIERVLNEADGSDTPLGERFDLITGTSAGALLAAGLAIGLHARTLMEVFDQNVRKIFPKVRARRIPLPGQVVKLRAVLKPMYDPAPLQATLNQVLENKTFDDVRTHLCIITVRLDNGMPRLYKSVYRDEFKQRSSERLADAVLASASAPIFFPAARGMAFSEFLVDGSLCANNPAMVAVVDAMNMQYPSPARPHTPLPKSLADIALLSIGTGEISHITGDPKTLANAGVLGWLSHTKDAIDILLNSQTVLTHEMVRRLLPRENYLRLSAEGMGRFEIDDVDARILRNASDLRFEDIEVIKRLFL